MRHTSPKRAAQNRAYLKARAPFLESRPWCESPLNCGQRAEVVHHRRGRSGLRLLDQEWWAASCVSCNDFAETETGRALALGWLVRVEGVAS